MLLLEVVEPVVFDAQRLFLCAVSCCQLYSQWLHIIPPWGFCC